MIRPIVRDVFFLRQKSEPATQADTAVDRDLRDTLQANREKCVGMAANMIGVRKRVIIVSLGFADTVMYNPVLISRDTPYEAEEGCLFLMGDNRGDSRDSRAPEIGLVDEREILGRAVFLRMPGTGTGEYTVERDLGRIGGLN